ncbi:MAG: hypothetical protein IJQ01_09465, partial [Selenomonadaceae bacterium]|nr:hypothetical protein [Selenomonadaceae bacterium]
MDTTFRYVNPGSAELLNTSCTTLAVDSTKSVTETAFYGSTSRSDNFGTPAGVKEIWFKFDLYLDSAMAKGNRFSFGHYSSALGGYVGVWNGADNFGRWDAPDKFLVDAKPTTALDTKIIGTRGAINHVLLHMKSDTTNGLIELTVNGTTYTRKGNINNGADFDCLYLYSDSSSALFSNIIVSSEEIKDGEGWHNISFDVERKVAAPVQVNFDVQRKVKTQWFYYNAGNADDLITSGTTLTNLPESKSITGTAFYQTTRAKCFDLPETDEIWIK